MNSAAVLAKNTAAAATSGAWPTRPIGGTGQPPLSSPRCCSPGGTIWRTPGQISPGHSTFELAISGRARIRTKPASTITAPGDLLGNLRNQNPGHKRGGCPYARPGGQAD